MFSASCCLRPLSKFDSSLFLGCPSQLLSLICSRHSILFVFLLFELSIFSYHDSLVNFLSYPRYFSASPTPLVPHSSIHRPSPCVLCLCIAPSSCVYVLSSFLVHRFVFLVCDLRLRYRSQYLVQRPPLHPAFLACVPRLHFAFPSYVPHPISLSPSCVPRHLLRSSIRISIIRVRLRSIRLPCHTS